MSRRPAFVLALTIAMASAGAGTSYAQHAHGTHRPAGPGANYAGQDARHVASLSAEEQEGFLQGRGMGLARAAEFNGFPGPMHILELADQLALTPHQRHQIEGALARMKAKAKVLGEQYVLAEKAVDAAFKDKTGSQELVAKRVAEAGDLLAQIRMTHLAAHLEITPLLSQAQIADYAKLRGYASGDANRQ